MHKRQGSDTKKKKTHRHENREMYVKERDNGWVTKEQRERFL